MKTILLFSAISMNVFANTSYYFLNTQIGNTTFKDILILTKNNTTTKGTLTVPGQFTTGIKNYSINTSTNLITFNISTLENNQPLNANYELKFINDDHLNGKLIIDSQEFPIEGIKFYEE